MKNRLKQNSYTLIEVLVAVAIFTIVIGGPAGLFIASIRGQARALATREIVDSSSYAIEYMSRVLRMARKDDVDFDGVIEDCLGGYKVNYGITHAGQGIKFRNYKDECQEFYLDGTLLKENRDGTIFPLTPDDLEITLLRFNLSGEGQQDYYQPRLTILIAIRKIGQPATEIRVQTTITQRNLDVEY